MRRPSRSVAAAWLLVLTGTLLGAGCERRAGQTPAAPSPDVFRIVATDHGFEAPDRLSAGLRHIEFVNNSHELHESMLVKLPAGMSAGDFVASIKAGSLFPEGSLDYSGPGLTSPGETTEQWLRVDPGNYLLICWNNDHATTRGTHAFIVVDDGARDDTPPPADAVLKLTDFRFELSTPLRKGIQVLKVENAGPSMHEADIYRLHDGKTVADLLQWSRQDGRGLPPAQALGGTLDSSDIRREVWIRRSFSPGHYAIQCEMPMSEDVQAGSRYATHTDAGMVLPFDIAE